MRGSMIWRRANARSCRVRSAARCAARVISAMLPSAGSPGAASVRASSAWPRIAVSRLLKSCAMPPASRPMPSMRCESRSCVSRRRSSEMSWPMIRMLATLALGVAQARGVPEEGAPRAVRRRHVGFPLANRLALTRLRSRSARTSSRCARRHAGRRGSRPDRHAAGDAEKRFGGQVPLDDATVGADDHDDAAGQFHERPVAVFARAQGQLGPHARRHVDRDAADQRRARGVSTGNFSVDHQCACRPRPRPTVVTSSRPAASRAPAGRSPELRRCSAGQSSASVLPITTAAGVLNCRPTLRCRTRTGHRATSCKRHGRREPHERAEPRLGRSMFRTAPATRSWTSAATISAVTETTFIKPASIIASPRLLMWPNGPQAVARCPRARDVPSSAMTAVTPGWPKRNAPQTIIGNVR